MTGLDFVLMTLRICIFNFQTFDVSDGDFASYLANASELTITNVREAGDDGGPNDKGDASASYHIQLNAQVGLVNYSI